MTNLPILSKDIRTLDNLYSLNDLVKTSVGNNRHRPSIFIKNQQTQELVNEIEQSSNSCFAIKRFSCIQRKISLLQPLNSII
ncbi:KilA-N domain-containing protein [Vibrio atlanticus]|uniref:KilA-N domain-containing protein n=1 Tax=Vibrio atlanticus TaxID=693153 RepID=UPI00355321F4